MCCPPASRDRGQKNRLHQPLKASDDAGGIKPGPTSGRADAKSEKLAIRSSAPNLPLSEVFASLPRKIKPGKYYGVGLHVPV